MGDGVLYVPLAIELDIYREDLGHPGRPDLAEVVDADRPHAVGKLQCLYCLNRRGRTEWGYLRSDPRSRYVFIFEHLNITIAAHHPPSLESDKHKSFVAFEVQALERVGVQAGTEKATRSRRARSDFRTYGAAVELAGEVQVTQLVPATVAKRTRIALEDGLTPIWTTDIANPKWIEKGPRAVVAPTTWQRIQAGTDLLVIGGARVVEFERCGRREPRCPATGRSRSCGNLHAYLTPARGLRLDDLVTGAATGEWRLLTEPNARGRVNYEWLPAVDLERYRSDRAQWTLRQPERPSREPQGISRACDRGQPAVTVEPRISSWRSPKAPRPCEYQGCSARLTRRYLPGWRCAIHTPAALAGRGIDPADLFASTAQLMHDTRRWVS